jgi:hypothetical protein
MPACTAPPRRRPALRRPAAGHTSWPAPSSLLLPVAHLLGPPPPPQGRSIVPTAGEIWRRPELGKTTMMAITQYPAAAGAWGLASGWEVSRRWLGEVSPVARRMAGGGEGGWRSVQFGHRAIFRFFFFLFRDI